MELLFFWGVPVGFAVLGFQQQLYRSFSKFVCFAFAAYLGVWSEKLISPLFGFLPQAAAPFQTALTMCVTGGALFVVLTVIYSSLNPRRNHYAFPQWVDRIGGALFGLFAGSVLISFVGVVLCLTPFRSALPLGLAADSIQERSASNLMAVTGTINLFSLQWNRNKACRERFTELFDAAAGVAAEEQEPDEAEHGEASPASSAEGRKKGMLTGVREQKEQRDREMEK